MMTTIERLNEISKKPTNKLTDDDKAFIVSLSAELGVEFTPRKKCTNCYVDQAIILHKRLKEPGEDGRRWHVLGDRVFRIEGRLFCEENMTDEDAERIMAMGFPRYWFKDSHADK